MFGHKWGAIFDRVQLHVMEIGTRNLTCSQVLTAISTLNSTSSRLITEVKQRTSPVSTWMGDRLGIPGAVEHFSDFVVCFTVSLIFGHFWNKKVFCGTKLCVLLLTEQTFSGSEPDLYTQVLTSHIYVEHYQVLRAVSE